MGERGRWAARDGSSSPPSCSRRAWAPRPAPARRRGESRRGSAPVRRFVLGFWWEWRERLVGSGVDGLVEGLDLMIWLEEPIRWDWRIGRFRSVLPIRASQLVWMGRLWVVVVAHLRVVVAHSRVVVAHSTPPVAMIHSSQHDPLIHSPQHHRQTHSPHHHQPIHSPHPAAMTHPETKTDPKQASPPLP